MAAADDWPAREKRPRPAGETAQDRVKRVQELIRRLPTAPPSVDEFIASKRREAAREA
jgi:hypothetical protein